MKLIKGEGTPATGGCWMVAATLYTTLGKAWHDHPDCVSPLIRSMCIKLNDWCQSDEERERLIARPAR